MSHFPYDTFRETLAIKYPNCGHALWEPSPGGLYDAVEVGDVGFVREGCFHRLFNALLPGHHPSHQNLGVPDYHQQLLLNVPNHIHRVMDGTDDFCSRHVNFLAFERDVHALGPDDDSRVTVTCPGRRGAMVLLPFPAQREDTIARGDFGRWIIRHIDLWFAFAQNLGLGISRMQDIILVTGRHCARSWVNVAFSEGQRDAEVSFGVRVAGTSSVNIERRLVRGDVVLKVGPTGENLPENQCVFVRGFRVFRLLKIWPRLLGQAGPSPDTSWHEPEPDEQLEPIGAPADADYPDPLDVLLQYIAETAPNCDLALVHDDDLAYIEGFSLDSRQPDALLEHLRRSAPEVKQVQYSYPSGNERGVGDSVIITIATLSKDEFPLESALSNVSSIKSRKGDKSQGNTRQVRYQVAPDDALGSTRTMIPEALQLPKPPPLHKQVTAVGTQQGAVKNREVSPSYWQPSDLSGRIARISKQNDFEGWFLDFCLGEWNPDGGYATLGRLRNQSPASKTRFKACIGRWQNLYHRNVLACFGYVEIDDIVYSVSPWMENGNIRDYVRKNPGADRLRLLSEVASGLEFLHEKGILRGAICSKNILVNGDATAFVCGFNLSDFNMTFDLSHARWLAPEYNKSASFHFPTEEPDVWSFGILCLEVFTGEDPYNSHSDFAAHTLLREGIIPEYPGSTAVGLSSRVWEIMQCCWRIDPDERPSISEIKLAIEALIPSHVSYPQISRDGVPVSRFYRSDNSPNLARQDHQWDPSSSSADALASMNLVSGAERLLWFAPDGTVSAGSLEGIATRVIGESAGSSTDHPLEATFLTTYQLFSTSIRLLEVVKRRSESTILDPTDTRSQYAILLFIENWLKKGFEDENLGCSSKIWEFVLAISHSGPQELKAKAAEIAGMVHDLDYVSLRQTGSIALPVYSPAERPPSMRPSDVAIVLTTITGNRFRRINHWEYVNFAQQRPNTQRIESFNTIHNLVTAWVQRSVLESNHLERRMKVYEEWIYTAQVCQHMNNFSSASAIVTALTSPTVTNLIRTCESKAKPILHVLDRDLTPTNGAYFETLRQAETKELIPWLEPHLSALRSTLARSDIVFEVDGHELIDFKLCSELAEQIDSVTRYSPPLVHAETRQDVLEYVGYKLQSSTADKLEVAVEARSAALAEEEWSMVEQQKRTQAHGKMAATPGQAVYGTPKW